MELCLVLDHACNLRCRYCYTGAKFAAPMTDAIMAKGVERALESGDDWLSVNLFGGEPLLHRGALHRVEAVVESVLARLRKRPTLRWLVDTNGTRFDDGSLEWLATRSNATVFLSIDGPAAIHDRQRVDSRGLGSHAQVLVGLRKLEERGIDFQIVAVVGPDTAADAATTMDYLLRFGTGRIALQTNLRCEWSEIALAAYRESARRAAEVLAREFEAGRCTEVEPIHSKVLSFLSQTRPVPSRCRLAARQLAIAPSGRLYACPEMVAEDKDGELCIGHVDTGIDASRLLELRSKSLGVHASCRTCPIRARCAYGCACRQLASSGAVGTVSALLCETESLWIDAADEMASSLAAQQNPAFMRMYYGSSPALP